jgi:hypothetical protein
MALVHAAKETVDVAAPRLESDQKINSASSKWASGDVFALFYFWWVVMS